VKKGSLVGGFWGKKGGVRGGGRGSKGLRWSRGTKGGVGLLFSNVGTGGGRGSLVKEGRK